MLTRTDSTFIFFFPLHECEFMIAPTTVIQAKLSIHRAMVMIIEIVGGAGPPSDDPTEVFAKFSGGIRNLFSPRLSEKGLCMR
jgi:hypothetical protein